MREGIPGAKSARRERRRTFDFDQLEGMPSSDELLQACSDSMAYLQVLLDFIQQSEENKDWNYTRLATDLIVGLIFLATLAGTLHQFHGWPF
jgi:hypothetical protein|tara:strand:- start:757 stop:1032 length:276 start_codon:yes stop_codon:yes gene_type:complete